MVSEDAQAERAQLDVGVACVGAVQDADRPRLRGEQLGPAAAAADDEIVVLPRLPEAGPAMRLREGTSRAALDGESGAS